MSTNVLSCVTDTQNLVSLHVRNLHSKLILYRHNDFNSVQGIKAEVISKLRGCVDFGAVDFVEVLDYFYDSRGDVGDVEEGLRCRRNRSEEGVSVGC